MLNYQAHYSRRLCPSSQSRSCPSPTLGAGGQGLGCLLSPKGLRLCWLKVRQPPQLLYPAPRAVQKPTHILDCAERSSTYLLQRCWEEGGGPDTEADGLRKRSRAWRLDSEEHSLSYI